MIQGMGFNSSHLQIFKVFEGLANAKLWHLLEKLDK